MSNTFEQLLRESDKATPVQPVKPSLWEQYHAAQPAQYKSLTDKQSAEMWLQVTLEPCTHEAAYLRGIKDAEAAHGIKENT